MQESAMLRTLRQTFCFPNTSAEALAALLREAPLVGEDSLFGKRTTGVITRGNDSWLIEDFQPLPISLFRFHVGLRGRPNEPHVFIVEFTQPRETRPYLAGEFVWRCIDAERQSACLVEEINTAGALEVVSKPLSGKPHSFRRYLFFAVGHKRLMADVAANLKRLLRGVR